MAGIPIQGKLYPNGAFYLADSKDFANTSFVSGASLDDALNTLSGGVAIPITKTLYVDKNRGDVYTADGSELHPFKTVQAAIDAAAVLNYSAGFILINIAPGVYAENLLLESAGIHKLIFLGHNGVTIQPVANDALHTLLLNNQLTDLIIDGITLGRPIKFGGIGSGFLSGGAYFNNCTLIETTQIDTAVKVQFNNSISYAEIYASSVSNLTLDNSNNAGNLTLESSNARLESSVQSGNVSLDATSTAYFELGSLIGVSGSALTINGVCHNNHCLVKANTTINTGGFLNNNFGFYSGTVTNSGGTINELTRKYLSHPSFTIDEQMVDKKYVDDKFVSFAVDPFTPTLGQTVFALSQSRITTAISFVTLNGQVKTESVDYTISGTVFTWLNPAGLTLNPTHELIVRYNFSPSLGTVVASVFGRAGAVIAVDGDYKASFVNNDSTVSGAKVSNALDTLLGLFAGKENTITTLPISKGGTNSSTALNGKRIMVSSDDAKLIGEAGALADGQLLIGSTGFSPVIGAITGASNQINVALGAGTVVISLPSGFYTRSYFSQPEYSANYGNYRVDTVATGGTTSLTLKRTPRDLRVVDSIKPNFFVSSGVATAGAGRNIDIVTEYCAEDGVYNQYTQSDTATTYNFTGKTDKLVTIDIKTLFTNYIAGMNGTIFWTNNAIGGNLYFTGVELNYTV